MRSQRAAWEGIPPAARLFLGLAALDVVVRATGIVGPALPLDLSQPIWTLTAVVPHSLLILLPALIVLRRPDAMTTAPNLLDGAILVALVQLLSFPTTTFAAWLAGTQGWAVVSIGGVGIQAVGWLLVARGLASLAGDPPRLPVAGLANLAAVGVLAAVVTSLVLFLTGPGFQVGVPELDELLDLNAAATIAGGGVLAFVYRASIRGSEDEGRPRDARRLGVAAALVAGGIGFALALVELAVLAGLPIARLVVESPTWGLLRWLGAGGAAGLLAVAFGLGLGGVGPRSDGEAVTLDGP